MFTHYPIETSVLIEVLSRGLDETYAGGKQYPGNREYTAALLGALVNAVTSGKAKEKYQCHPDPTEPDRKECLWDCSWWLLDTNKRLALTLAVESEWGKWYDVRYDLDKLLVAKCPLKLLVTDSGGFCPKGLKPEHHREEIRKDIEARLQEYLHHIQGERYIWADVQGSLSGGKIYAYEFTAPASGINKPIRLQPLPAHKDAPKSDPFTSPYRFASLAIPTA